jgi:trans-2,3-dihydro-3-hydroxyanthranilate isomerase
MREYRFVQVDVFTDRVFGGNPLAVVLDAAGLSDGEMQSITREMNLSETTFLLPPTRPDCAARLRIFTPAHELPFAGHPTIGTGWVLCRYGLAPKGATRFALEEGIGPVEVTLEGDPASPTFLWMRHREPEWGPEVRTRAAVARALGLVAADLLPGAPTRPGSTGSAFLFVPLRDREAVDRAALDVPAILQVFGDGPRLGVFVFAPDADPRAGRVYSRMFAPHTSGIPEDPATGSASGPLGAYLVLQGLATGDGEIAIVSEQGTKMGRQSFIHVRVRRDSDGCLSDLRVGGSVVPVIEGRLTLP